MSRQFQRLSCLTLADAILNGWLVSIDTRTILSGFRHLVDRTERRDLNKFQNGLRLSERRLIYALAFQMLLYAFRLTETVR